MAYFHSPQIVKDGLVLYLDAGNTKSYPGTGINWNNFIRVNNATLFAAGVGGVLPTLSQDTISIQFSGSSDGGTNQTVGGHSTMAAYSQINFSGSDPFTVVSAFYFRDYPPQRNYSDTNNTTSLLNKNSFNPSYGINITYDLPSPATSGSFTRARIYGGVRNLTGTSGVTIGYGIAEVTSPIASPLTPNTWYNAAITHTWNPSLTRHELAMYINGSLSTTANITPPSVSGTSYPINFFNTGNINMANPNILGGNGCYSNVNIGLNMIYNRALTATEILQNHNAIKSRLKL